MWLVNRLVDRLMPTAPLSSIPLWLRNWKYLMANFLEQLMAVQTMVLNYAAMSMRPKIKDYILDNYFPAQTAVTMLKTVTAAMVQKNNQMFYPNDPSKCLHPSGLRTYGAAGYKIHICDLCGNRWQESKDKDKSLILCAPKASPTAKTPLGLKIGKPHFPKSTAMSSTETSRATSSEAWGSSSVGARRSQSRSLSVMTSKAKPVPKPSARLTARALAQQQQMLEVDDVSMGSWDLQEQAPQQAASVSYAPSLRSSRILPGRRSMAAMEPPAEEELIIGEHGEHRWHTRQPVQYHLDDEEEFQEEPEEETGDEFSEDELQQPLQ